MLCDKMESLEEKKLIFQQVLVLNWASEKLYLVCSSASITL